MITSRLAACATAALSAALLVGGLPPRAEARIPATNLPQPTAAARSAGVEPGNAPMGWSQRAAALTTDLNQRSRVAAPRITGVLGIDVSSWQGNVNWPAQRAAGRSFAFVKATESTSYQNPYFAGQFSGAYAAGMYRGAYHFAIPSRSAGSTQANYFVDHGGAWLAENRRLPGVLDIEYNPYGSTCYGLSQTAMVNWVASFVAQYKLRTGRDAIIYTTLDWWTRCTGNSTRFNATNPLWVARYGTSTPGTLPGGWPFYTFWQYSSSPIDQNKFSAPLARLQVLAG